MYVLYSILHVSKSALFPYVLTLIVPRPLEVFKVELVTCNLVMWFNNYYHNYFYIRTRTCIVKADGQIATLNSLLRTHNDIHITIKSPTTWEEHTLQWHSMYVLIDM